MVTHRRVCPAGLSKLLRHKISKHTPPSTKAGLVLPAEAAAGDEPQDYCPVIQFLLEALDLSIYCDAFLLAGWGGGTSSVADLAALTETDLAQVQALSKVPILPHHQSLILAACRQLGASLVSTTVLSKVSAGILQCRSLMCAS